MAVFLSFIEESKRWYQVIVIPEEGKGYKVVWLYEFRQRTRDVMMGCKSG